MQESSTKTMKQDYKVAGAKACEEHSEILKNGSSLAKRLLVNILRIHYKKWMQLLKSG